jgi:hypothetical protein
MQQSWGGNTRYAPGPNSAFYSCEKKAPQRPWARSGYGTTRFIQTSSRFDRFLLVLDST